MTTITATNAYDLAAAFNARFAAGEVAEISGRQIKSYSEKPAQVWGNGSISVDVKTRTGNGVTKIWFKQGQTFVLDI